MKAQDTGFRLLVACSILVSITPLMQAQTDPDRLLTNFDRLVTTTKAAQARLGAEAARLSGRVQQVFGLANRADEVRAFLVQLAGVSAPEPPGLLSRFAGFTESEPSVA